MLTDFSPVSITRLDIQLECSDLRTIIYEYNHGNNISISHAIYDLLKDYNTRQKTDLRHKNVLKISFPLVQKHIRIYRVTILHTGLQPYFPKHPLQAI